MVTTPEALVLVLVAKNGAGRGVISAERECILYVTFRKPKCQALFTAESGHSLFDLLFRVAKKYKTRYVAWRLAWSFVSNITRPNARTMHRSGICRKAVVFAKASGLFCGDCLRVCSGWIWTACVKTTKRSNVRLSL